MRNGWLSLIRSGGDESIGAGLVRLAREAEAVHRYEVSLGSVGSLDRVGGTGSMESLVFEGGVTVGELEALLGGRFDEKGGAG